MAVFDSLNEAQFVRRAVSGDSEAFHKLFDLLAAPLAVFVERMGVSAADAEEVAADALVKVHKSLPTYRERGTKMTTWVFEIAPQLCHRLSPRHLETGRAERGVLHGVPTRQWLRIHESDCSHGRRDGRPEWALSNRSVSATATFFVCAR